MDQRYSIDAPPRFYHRLQNMTSSIIGRYGPLKWLMGVAVMTVGEAAPVRRARDFAKHRGWGISHLVLAALGARGCSRPAPLSPLSPQEVAGLKLTAVAVTFKPDAQIQWDDGLRLYAESKGLNYLQRPAGVTPEEQVFMRDALTRKLKEAMTKDLGATLHGSRPIRLDVSVIRFDITSPLQRVGARRRLQHECRRQHRRCAHRRGHPAVSE